MSNEEPKTYDEKVLRCYDHVVQTVGVVGASPDVVTTEMRLRGWFNPRHTVIDVYDVMTRLGLLREERRHGFGW